MTAPNKSPLPPGEGQGEGHNLLTAHLPLLAGAPNGIKKLRELILELAVRGKLVPQDPSDEPASELLKRIAEEKARLVAEGKINKQKPLAAIAEEEKPYKLPDSWAWVRLPDVYYSVSVSGNKLLSSQISEEGIFPVVDQGKRFVAGYTDDESLLIRLPGPVVVFGDHTTERKYVDFDFVAGADGVKILRPVLLDEKFFWWHLVGLKLEGRGYARHFKVLNDAFFALPPKGEQSRIVTKVDELMALCDRLEAQQADAESAHAQLVQALLDSLTQTTDTTDFAANWQRLAEHFHNLFTTESSIDALKQTLLQLAVMGKLVPQDCSDGHASELLALKTDGEFCSTLPIGWVCVKGEDVAGLVDPHPSHRTPPVVLGGVPYIGYSDISFSTGINFEKARKVGSVVFTEHQARYQLKEGDFVFGKIGTIGKPFFLAPPFNYCLSANLILIQPNLEYVAPRYLAFYFDSPIFLAVLERDKTNSTHAVFGIKKARETLVPLPPLAEQHRIVAKVDQLMALCDQLKTRLTQARQLNEQLASTLVEQAVA